MEAPPSQRVGPLAHLPAVLMDLDVSLDAAFAGSGLRPDQLQREARFPFPDLAALMERCAVVARCSHLGLLVGARSDQGALGAIGEMMACARTLGEALRAYVGLQIGYSRGAAVYLQRFGDDVLLGYGIYDPGVGPGRQVHDLVIALGCNMVRSLTGGRVQPLRALVGAGVPESLVPYRKVLRTPLAFDQEQTAIVLARADLDLPLPGADPVRHRALRAAIQRHVRGDLDDTAAQVRHVLRPRLMLGEADRATVARELGVSPRTLARHLARAGTSFEVIKDEMRFTVARELLALTRLPIGRIAEALAYSAHSTLDHAFLRWTGMAPSHWRTLNTESARRPDGIAI